MNTQNKNQNVKAPTTNTTATDATAELLKQVQAELATAKAQLTVPTKSPKAPKVAKVSKEQFLASPALEVTLGTQKFLAMPREFSTGSYGYNLSGKVTLSIDGTPVEMQISCNITVIGSKLRTTNA